MRDDARGAASIASRMPLAAQVELAVAQAQQSRRPARPRRSGTAASRASASASSVGDADLDLAGRQVRVDVARLAARRPRRAAETTCSGRSALGEREAPRRAVSGWKTSWTSPVRSRRSMKIRPPWSRRRCTQPATRTSLAGPARVERAAPGVAVGVGRRGAHQHVPPAQHLRDHRGRALDRLLLAALHVLQLDPLVAEHGNVPGAAGASACLSWPFSERPASSSWARAARRGAPRAASAKAAAARRSALGEAT